MQIPDYQIVCKCGQGAYGEVWIALNRIDSWVAIKTVIKSEQVEKELAGLRSYSRISGSPHLIRIFHVGEIGNLLYYTMELADNLGSEKRYIPATLANVLQERKRFTPAETVGLGSKLLAGLETLHQAGLVHRDIKPENILFVSGEPKLSDIGLMRSVSQSLSLGGTLGFIPPERLKSGSGGKNGSDDLYALGKVLYCCLTGNSVEDYPSFPVSLLDEAYCHLNEVILTACNKNTALRFKNAGEFQHALKSGISRRQHIRSIVIRMRYWGLGLLVITILVVAGFWLWYIAHRQESEDEFPATLPSKVQQRVAPRQKISRALQIGEIQNRFYDSASSAYIDPVFRKFPPEDLDLSPRRPTTILNSFTSSKWKEFDASEFRRTSSSLKIFPGVTGVLRLMIPLDFDYVIRFEINDERLEDLLTFQVYSPEHNTFYQWTLAKHNRKLSLKPLEYQTQDGERKLLFQPKVQPKETPGFHKVEMLQTAKIFRLYMDGELVLYAPSFFFGGYFAIIVPAPGESNFVEIKNFELLRIPYVPECPPEEQYKLPKQM